MRYAVTCLVALFGLGCNVTGPKEDLTGYWLARVLGPATSYQYGMTLRQSGDTIMGVACAKSFDLLLYKDTPVFGDYPDLSFTVGATQTQPCCAGLAGSHFAGKQDDTRDIVGSYGQMDLRFQRSTTPLCN